MNPDWLSLDQQHVWHPYSAIGSDLPVYPVDSAEAAVIRLSDGRELVDGMASWWCAIHGYNHPVLNQAIQQQLQSMAHVMFGGLTHAPAVRLAQKLVTITPARLDCVFFADSGSVSVEVALKMAIQYWHSRGQAGKQRFISLRQGYHGDTLGAMSVCDPVTGMHQLFNGILPQQLFADTPVCRFGEACEPQHLASMRQLLEQYHQEVAAVILEPIVQGAGGMWFYSADYLAQARALCDEYQVLLIADEIATGFGRTGKLFACEHAGISPDILCIGKAMTGGYLSMAATLTSREIADTIHGQPPGVFMHGPTFMGNPLASAVSLASIELLLQDNWQRRVMALEQGLKTGLEPCRNLPGVNDVRCLGGIGVVELEQPVDLQRIIPMLVERGVWLRPFGHLVYLMPPYIVTPEQLQTLTTTVCEVLGEIVSN